MAGGIAIYPVGWNSGEVKQLCGGTSEIYTLGNLFIFNHNVIHLHIFPYNDLTNIVSVLFIVIRVNTYGS